jgi:hypothetical protein
MGDMNVLDFVKNVGRNVVIGGMYSLVKAGVDTVKTGNPSALLTQGLDIGMASTGNQLAVDLGGEKAGMAFNAAGGGVRGCRRGGSLLLIAWLCRGKRRGTVGRWGGIGDTIGSRRPVQYRACRPRRHRIDGTCGPACGRRDNTERGDDFGNHCSRNAKRTHGHSE